MDFSYEKSMYQRLLYIFFTLLYTLYTPYMYVTRIICALYMIEGWARKASGLLYLNNQLLTSLIYFSLNQSSLIYFSLTPDHEPSDYGGPARRHDLTDLMYSSLNYCAQNKKQKHTSLT
jgi:hypothetical protein